MAAQPKGVDIALRVPFAVACGIMGVKRCVLQRREISPTATTRAAGLPLAFWRGWRRAAGAAAGLVRVPTALVIRDALLGIVVPYLALEGVAAVLAFLRPTSMVGHATHLVSRERRDRGSVVLLRKGRLVGAGAIRRTVLLK